MGIAEANLAWSPIGPQILYRCADERGVRLLIAPFIQRDALAHLLDHLPSHADLKIVTRWTAGDIAAGVSDPFVYEECATRKIPLYLHSAIHLKLFTMGSGLCFCGSSNITTKGLGIHANGNIEAGVWSSMALSDWHHVYEIINGSRLTDDDTFRAAVTYRDKFLHSAPPLPPLELPACPPRDFTLASLPASLDPRSVAKFAVLGAPAEDQLDVNCIMHDLVEFGGVGASDPDAALAMIGAKFLAQPFVRQIVEHVRTSKSLRFGEVASWIHSHCRDVPLPYRWEVKEATHVLYNWLAHFVPQISWSVPGHRSQVICWTDTTAHSDEGLTP